MPNQVHIDINQLIIDYNNGEGLSSRQLAIKYNTSKQTIKKKLLKANITVLSSKEFIKQNNDKHRTRSAKRHITTDKTIKIKSEQLRQEWDNRDNLYKLYIEDKLSTITIATKYGTCDEVIRDRLHRYNINIRSLSEATQIAAIRDKRKRAELSKSLWQRPTYKELISSKLRGKKIIMPQSHNDNVSSAVRAWYQIPENYQAHIDQIKKSWQTPSAAMIEHLKNLHIKCSQRFTSKIELITGGILNDYNIINHKIYIGKYEFDYYVNRPTKKDLLLEVNGLYWHFNNKNKIISDQAKYDYWKNNLADQYDLQYLWEHEYSAQQSIYTRLSQFVDLSETIDYDLNQVTIQMVDHSAAERFLSKYHYLGKLHHGKYFAAILDNQIIACAAISGCTRQESASKHGLSFNMVRELSRFCIHPRFNRKNLGSWFMARVIDSYKQKFPEIKLLISFADPTVGHNGILYRACNWCFDGMTKPSYHYQCGPLTWHKRTIWGYAKKLKIKENEFTTAFQLAKIETKGKYRYIYHMK